MKWFSIVLIFLIYLNIDSCSKASSEYPAYLKCDSAILKPNIYGEPNSNIFGLQVSIGTDNRGTWQMPFRMPILKEGVHSVFISPIIKFNDLTTLFGTYPFYKSKLVDLNLIKNKTIDTIFTFEYIDSLRIIMNEPMDLKTNFNTSELNSFARNGANSMMLKADPTTIDSSATAFYYKPINFKPTETHYMELDYFMASGVLGVGIAYTDNLGQTKIAILGNRLVPHNQWRHVYIDLNPVLAKNTTTQFAPVFILIPENGASNAKAFIDNIKILVK
jgi:hypothetical protein